MIPADDGAYTTAPTDEQLVHELEHGRVIIWFQPSLPEDDAGGSQGAVRRRTLPDAPRAAHEDALPGWPRARGTGPPTPAGRGRLLLCKQVTPGVWDALRAFRDENRSNGPEPIP